MKTTTTFRHASFGKEDKSLSVWRGLFVVSMSNATNNTSSIYPNISSSDAKVISSLLVSLGLFIVLMTFFLCCRRRYPQIYATWSCGEEKDIDPPGAGLFGWVKSAFSVSILWILQHRGLDAVVYILMLRYMILVSSSRYETKKKKKCF